jgi:hypothetical protein
LTDDRHPFLTLYCSHCGRPLKVCVHAGPPDRTCPTCRKKWFGYHYKSLLKIISPWPSAFLLTLTYKNIPDKQWGGWAVKQIRGDFTKLRRRFKEIHGGFYVVQATNNGRGWHLHLHVIFDGCFIAKERLSRAWADITKGSYIVDIRAVRDPKTAIRYLLADFTGAPRIRPEDYEDYNGVFRDKRLVQPFGKYRNVKLRAPFPCPACGRIEWVLLETLLGEKKRFRRQWDEGP